MTEVAPVPAVAGSSKARKAPGPSVSDLLTQAVSASKERSGVSLAALKKSLAASGYDVEKNNSRIKMGLKNLVSKGTLVQTKGTGASGSFKLGKPTEAAPKPAKKKAVPAPKGKKPAATKGVKKAAAAAKKTPKKRVSTAGGAKKAAKSPAKAKVTKPKKTTKSPAKALKPKAKAKPKPKPSKAKVVSRKK